MCLCNTSVEKKRRLYLETQLDKSGHAPKAQTKSNNDFFFCVDLIVLVHGQLVVSNYLDGHLVRAKSFPVIHSLLHKNSLLCSTDKWFSKLAETHTPFFLVCLDFWK